jgi:hypothetical protein
MNETMPDLATLLDPQIESLFQTAFQKGEGISLDAHYLPEVMNLVSPKDDLNRCVVLNELQSLVLRKTDGPPGFRFESVVDMSAAHTDDWEFVPVGFHVYGERLVTTTPHVRRSVMSFRVFVADSPEREESEVEIELSMGFLPNASDAMIGTLGPRIHVLSQAVLRIVRHLGLGEGA